MRIGSFWGLPAPMFVLAEDDRDNGLQLLREFIQVCGREQLQDLRKEFVQLLGIRKLVGYKNKVCISADSPNWHWSHGGIVEDSDSSTAFRREFIERTLADLLNGESHGIVRDAAKLEEGIDSFLSSEVFELSEVDKVVKRAVRTFQKTDGGSSIGWLKKYSLEQVIVDAVVTDGKMHKLTDQEKTVVQYFVGRLPDVEIWVAALVDDRPVEGTAFGVPISSLVTRNPRSIQYSIMALFEPIKNNNNAKMLLDIVRSIRKDSIEFKEKYKQLVSVLGDDGSISSEGRGFEEMPDFFRSEKLSCAGFNWYSIPEEDQRVLISVSQLVQRLTPESMSETLDVVVDDFTQFGKELCEVGICGINRYSAELFTDAILSTVMSSSKIYRSEEIIEQVNWIMDNYVDALVDTIIPVGEKLE